MNPKARPNHSRYIEILRSMTPEQRLRKAFELTSFAKGLFREGLRKRFPELSQAEFEQLLRQRMDLCHNRNY